MRKTKLLGLTLSLLIVLLGNSACGPTAQTAPTPTLAISSFDDIPTSAFNGPTPSAVPVELTPEEAPRPEEADLALSFGDYDQALALYREVSNSGDNDLVPSAKLGEAITLSKQGHFSDALKVLNDIKAAYPGTVQATRASFWIGELTDPARPQEAIDAYSQFVDADGGALNAFVYEKMADLQGDPVAKFNLLEKAYQASGDDPQLGLVSKYADSLLANGHGELAIAALQKEFDSSQLDYSKAYLEAQMGDIEAKRGNTEKAYEHYQNVANNYPLTGSGYTALASLVNDNIPVNELMRGIINYNVGQDRLAIEAFDRYLGEAGAVFADKAIYYKALATRRAGLGYAALGTTDRETANASGGLQQDRDALTLWNQLIDNYPHSDFYIDAMEDVVYTIYAYMGDTQKAIDTANEYVSRLPDGNYVPRLLAQVSQYELELGHDDKAVEALTRIGIQFPSSDLAFQSLLRAGVIQYRNGQFGEAQKTFNRASLIAYIPETSQEGSLEQAGANLWLGKTAYRLGDITGAESYLQTAIRADTNGYYGLRAKEIIDGKEPFASPSGMNFEVDLNAERTLAASWLRTSLSLPDGTNMDYSKQLFEEPAFKRAVAYYKLGLFSDARLEFTALRSKYDGDIENNFRLIKVFLDYNYYDQAILSAQTVVRLTGYLNDLLSPKLPIYFAHVLYGAYYLPWVSKNAEHYNVPTTVLLSLIRQESLFAANSTSSAGAMGIMQLMPATAEDIANDTGWPENFTTQSLQNANVSLTLGTNYLARQMIAFDRDVQKALAAYNAGPGSVLGWSAIAGDDPDVFAGTITYLETRTYIRKIAENYDMYLKIYGN